MNANEESSALVAGELERIARATEAACPMCELYEHKERRLRGVIEAQGARHTEQQAKLDEARRWKSWCLAAVLVIIVVVGGLAVRP